MIDSLRESDRIRDAIRAIKGRMRKLYNQHRGEDGYNDDLIPGRCPQGDSCEQCRAARRADKGYQTYLNRLRAIELVTNQCSVYSDLESRALQPSEVLNIRRRWLAELQIRYNAFLIKEQEGYEPK
jgi:hypothetical protein